MVVPIEERNKIIIAILNVEAKNGASPGSVMGNV